MMDQDGSGQDATIEDIKRVLGTYSNLSDDEINNFLKINTRTDEIDSLQTILKRVSKAGGDAGM